MNSADMCRANGWGPGTILIGEPDIPSGRDCVIRVTAVGEDIVLARRLFRGRWVGESQRTLECRPWREWWITKRKGPKASRERLPVATHAALDRRLDRRLERVEARAEEAWRLAESNAVSCRRLEETGPRGDSWHLGTASVVKHMARRLDDIEDRLAACEKWVIHWGDDYVPDEGDMRRGCWCEPGDVCECRDESRSEEGDR